MQLLFVTSELSPINGDTDLGRMVWHLGGALCSLGHNVTACLPLCSTESIESLSLARRLTPLTIDMPEGPISLHLFDGKLPNGVKVKLFSHPEIYENRQLDEGDDVPLRYAVLAKAALTLAGSSANQKNDWHIVHSFGLGAAFAPFFAPAFPRLAEAKTLLSLDELSNQGRCEKSWVEKLGLPWEEFTPNGFEFYDELNILKAGLTKADRILLAGHAMAFDARSEAKGHGLHGLMASKQDSTSALLPGLDYSRWNPTTDIHLPVHYDAEQQKGKRSCKARLQNVLGLPVRTDVPILSCAPSLGQSSIAVSETLSGLLPQILRDDIQLIVPQGTTTQLGDAVENIRGKKPKNVAQPELSEVLWHQILAGSDLMLLDAPKSWDTEELLASLRYGALPIVRSEGIARDIIVDMSGTLESGNGFLVHNDEPAELLAVLRRALASLRYGEPFSEALARIMSHSYSWENTATQLEQIYAELLPATEAEEDEIDLCKEHDPS